MRVYIITNTHEQCGNYQYAKDIKYWLGKYHEVDLGERTFMGQGADVVFINWHPARVELTSKLVRELQGKGSKVIIIHQNSTDYLDAGGPDSPFRLADGIVSHEPVESFVKVTYIPHAIHPVAEVLADEVPLHQEFTIGTAGFAFPWKRADLIPEAARRVSGRAVVIASPHEYYNVNREAAKWKNVCMKNNLSHDIFTEWWEKDKVSLYLAQSHVNIFWFQSKDIHDTFGQTGSARLGAAAGRPMIISRHRKFRTMLEEFEDEFYVAETEEDVFRLVTEIREAYMQDVPVRKPNRILKEQGWEKCASKYDDLITEVCGVNVSYNAT